MMRVVDAGVLIKAYIPEVGSEYAAALFDRVAEGAVELLAPDLIYPETGNILWKKVRRGELTSAEAQEVGAAIGALPLRIEGGRVLLPLALDIALACGVTVYDALYVALASVYDSRMLSADGKLVALLANTPFSEQVELLAEH